MHRCLATCSGVAQPSAPSKFRARLGKSARQGVSPAACPQHRLDTKTHRQPASQPPGFPHSGGVAQPAAEGRRRALDALPGSDASQLVAKGQSTDFQAPQGSGGLQNDVATQPLVPWVRSFTTENSVASETASSVPAETQRDERCGLSLEAKTGEGDQVSLTS